MPLVEAIVADPAFTSDAAIRAKVRTPLEKAATVSRLPRAVDVQPEAIAWMLDKLAYLPFHAPNRRASRAATASWTRPGSSAGSSCSTWSNLDEEGAAAIDIPLALGLFDLSDDTRSTLNRFPRAGMRLGLAFGCPEFPGGVTVTDPTARRGTRHARRGTRHARHGTRARRRARARHRQRRDASRLGCNLVSRRRFLVGLGAAVTVAACGMQGITVYQRNPTPGQAPFALPGTSATPGRRSPPGRYRPPTERWSSWSWAVATTASRRSSRSTARYRDLRPATAITDPVVLDSDIGLHPNLAGVAGLYRDGRVAVVQGLGIDKPDLSHFISMRRWWDGTDKPDFTGWLGRYLDAAVGYEEVLGGISVGPAPSPAMLGTASYVVGIADASGLASGFPWWVDDARDFAGVHPVRARDRPARAA